ncbi:hypothetical protein M5689_006218 [Euphorbia peplus]|nr:hypothetical protein M5689_006218 [Euphorbia peplus]
MFSIWSFRDYISLSNDSRLRSQRCSSRSQRCSSRSQRCSSRNRGRKAYMRLGNKRVKSEREIWECGTKREDEGREGKKTSETAEDGGIFRRNIIIDN